MIVSLMTYAMLNTTDGFINRLLERFELEGVSWYSTPEPWPAILTLIYIWKFAGYYSVIFLAVIAGISSEYYESAKIDGGNRIQLTLHITIPMLIPTVLILSLLGVGRIFYGDFGMIYGIIGDNGILFPTTDVIDTYSFRAMRKLGNFSMASAVVLYQSVLGMIAIIFFNWIVRRINRDSALF
jgi:putative aldouronate transport system permease protein